MNVNPQVNRLGCLIFPVERIRGFQSRVPKLEHAIDYLVDTRTLWDERGEIIMTDGDGRTVERAFLNRQFPSC